MEDFDTCGSMLDQGFYDKLAVTLAERVKLCGSKVLVLTGRSISCWEVYFHLYPLKASLVRCLDRYSGKWEELIPIFVLQYCPPVWKRPNCKYGRRSMESSWPTGG